MDGASTNDDIGEEDDADQVDATLTQIHPPQYVDDDTHPSHDEDEDDDDDDDDYAPHCNASPAKPGYMKRTITRISEEDTAEISSQYAKNSRHADSDVIVDDDDDAGADEGDAHVPLKLGVQREPSYVSALDERGADAEGTPRDRRRPRHEFGPRTPRTDSEPGTPRDQTRNLRPEGESPQMLFREPSMVRISEEGEPVVVRSTEGGAVLEAGGGVDVLATPRRPTDDRDRGRPPREAQHRRQQPEGEETTHIRPLTVQALDDEDEFDEIHNLMILENLPRDDINYAQKIYRQLGLDSGDPSPPKRRGPSRQKAVNGDTPRGLKSNQGSPVKSSDTSAVKSVESTPRKSRASSRQTSDASARLGGNFKPGVPPASRRAKRAPSRKQRAASPHEDVQQPAVPARRFGSKLSLSADELDPVAGVGLRRSRTTLSDTAGWGLGRERTSLSEIEPRQWRRTLHAQRPLSRSATDMRPMREDSFYCVTNLQRRRPNTTMGARSGDYPPGD